MNLPNLSERPLSYSSLMVFKRSPAHYMYYLDHPTKETPALLFGRFFHALILQPDKVKSKFVVAPNVDRRTTLGKLHWELFTKTIKNKTIISEGDWNTALEMQKAITVNEAASKCINQIGQTEKKIKFAIKGLEMISYIDGISENFLFELKTTTDASPDRWYREAYNFNYHIQAGVYQKGYAAKTGKYMPMRYLVIEKTEPYGISIMNATSDYMDAGTFEFSKLVDEFKYCMKNKLFEMSYDFRAVGDYYTLDLPPWAKND